MEAAELEPSTQRYCLAIAYDGGRFHGCQAQRGVPTVHGALDAALREINVTRRAAKAQRPTRSSEPPTSDSSRGVEPTSVKTVTRSDEPRNSSDAGSSSEAASPINIVFAGRTDQGVHATRMVVHVDLPLRHKPTSGDSSENSNSLRNGGEALPAAVIAASLRASLQRAGAAVSITSVAMVPSSFHARVSASERVYEYLIAVPCDDDAARRRRAHDLGDDNEMLSDPCAGFSLESPKVCGEKVKGGATTGTCGAPPASALHSQRMWAVSLPLLTPARARKLGFSSKVSSTDEKRPPFDVDIFKQALAAFEGTNNFEAFRAKSCPAPCAVRTVSECRVMFDTGSGSTVNASAGAASAFNSSVTVHSPGSSSDASLGDSATPLAVSPGRLMTVRIRAPAFLYHQVRCMVGAAAHVATGELLLEQLMAWLVVPSEPDGARERMNAAISNSTSPPPPDSMIKGAAVPLMAPAAGLYFAGTLYRREAMVPLPAGVIYRPPLSRTDDAVGGA